MLPAEQRLRYNQDFRRLYARGRSHVHPLAILYVLRRPTDDKCVSQERRIGFVVSKKQGDAVIRNRIKRRLREAVRLRLSDLREGPFDLAFVGRSRAKNAPWPDVENAIGELLRRAGLLRDPAQPPQTARAPVRPEAKPDADLTETELKAATNGTI